MTIVVVSLYVWPNAFESMALSSRAFAAGEYWRLFTSPFVHSSTLHLLWNLFAVCVGGFILERLNRAMLISFLILGTVAIGPTTLWLRDAPIALTSGFSDLGSGIFVLVLLCFIREGKRLRDFWVTTIPIVLLVMFMTHELGLFGNRTVLEMVTGEALNPKQFKLGHIVGASIGAVSYAIIRILEKTLFRDQPAEHCDTLSTDVSS